jgi:VanZ family protein
VARFQCVDWYCLRSRLFAMATFFQRFAIISCLGVVLFFALKPHPEVPHGLAPEELRIYLNSHDAVRNQFAFGLFGAAALFSLMTRTFLNRRQLLAILLIGLLIPALEIAQIWMPGRYVDMADVLNGWLGLGFACAGYALFAALRQIATQSRKAAPTSRGTRN